MVVKNLEVFVLDFVLPKPIADARNIIYKRSTALIKITSEDGLVGWGEAASFADSGSLVKCVIEHFKPRILGSSVFDGSVLHAELLESSVHYGRRGVVVSAISGIDLALWDLKARILNVSVWQLIGRQRPSVTPYYNAGYYDPDSPSKSLIMLGDSLESCLERGATGVKIKLGRFGQADDIERIRFARKVVGDEVSLMVDFNSQGIVHDLLQIDKVCQEFGVRWIEEPIRRGGRGQLASLRNRLITPIAGYEIEMLLDGYYDLLCPESVVDVVQPDAIWSGGLTEVVKIAAVAEAVGIELAPHNFASIIGSMANTVLACFATTGGLIELDSNPNPFLTDIVAPGSFNVRDNSVYLSSGIGWGIDLDEELVSNWTNRGR